MTEANTPAWLAENNDFGGDALSSGNDATTTSAGVNASNTTVGPSSNNASTTETKIDNADLPAIILTMRLCNMLLASYLILVSVSEPEIHR
jgi:hypothetical protein